jgi:hypothetical protein
MPLAFNAVWLTVRLVMFQRRLRRLPAALL